jgi:hypothetical protein
VFSALRIEKQKRRSLTLNHPSRNLAPDTVAGDTDIFADCRRVVHVGAVELVAEQEGLVVLFESVCRFGVAAAVGESNEGGYDAEDEVVDAHFGGWRAVDSGAQRSTKRLEIAGGVANDVEV